MYAVRRWNEERIIQGLAVAMCLAIVAVPILSSASAEYYLISKYVLSKNPDTSIRDDGAAAATVGSALFGVGVWVLGTEAARDSMIIFLAGAGVTTAGAVLIAVGVGLLA